MLLIININQNFDLLWGVPKEVDQKYPIFTLHQELENI